MLYQVGGCDFDNKKEQEERLSDYMRKQLDQFVIVFFTTSRYAQPSYFADRRNALRENPHFLQCLNILLMRHLRYSSTLKVTCYVS